jgi:hypothetical protein
MEGVSNILLLGFQTTITKKKQEITNNADFSLPIPRERDQTLVSPSKFTISIKRTIIQEVCITPPHPFTKR